MTRKDYIRIADALRCTRPKLPASSWESWQTWRSTVIAIADELSSDNVRFDRERFYKAAGLTDPEAVAATVALQGLRRGAA